MDFITLQSFLPEIFLSVFSLIILLSNSIIVISPKYNYPILNKEIFSQCFCILFCLLFLFINNSMCVFDANFLFINDCSSIFVKFFVVGITIFVLFPLYRSYFFNKYNFIEYFILLLFSLFSLLLLVSASDLLAVYLVIELQSLCFYIMVCIRRNSTFSIEAGIKYFVSGSFFSGIFLFGCSLIYGVLGALNLHAMNLLLSVPFSLENEVGFYLLVIGILFVSFTLLFKAAVFPFHFWAPDVYEGAPLASTIILSILPKFSIFYFFVKWISVVGFFFDFIHLLFFISGFSSLFLGSIFALTQKRFKRFLIFSSIAQIGFLTTALSINTVSSISAIFFFLVVYICTSFLLWYHFVLISNFQSIVQVFFSKLPSPLFLSNLSFFFVPNRLWAFSTLLIFFSLAGIPPLVGFFSKIFVVISLIESNEIANSFFLVILSSISVFYYLRIVKIIFFEKIEMNSFFPQVLFFDNFLITECFLIVFFLFVLFFLFLFPSFLWVLSLLNTFYLFF